MDRNRELLNHYIDCLYGDIKEYFPMLTDEIDISLLKDYLVDPTNIHKSKKTIEELFNAILQEYINAKHDLVKLNLDYKSTRYNLFFIDYEIAHKFLKESNFVPQFYNNKFPKLANNITIENCKDIVFKFFSELYKGDNITIEKIHKIIYNDIKLHYEQFRSATKQKEIHLHFSNDLLFLITMAHEVAHAIGYNYGTMYSKTDLRTIEIPSYFTEKIFIDYLINEKEKILEDNNSVRALNKKDKKYYYNYFYYVLFCTANRIYNEFNFKMVLNEENDFDMNSYEKFRYLSSGDLMINDYLKIDDVLNKYLPEEYRYLDIDDLTEISKKQDEFVYNSLETFEADIRYLTSMLLSFFFDKIKANSKIKDSYKEIIKDTIYDIYDISRIFEFDIGNKDDIYSIVTAFMEKHRKYLNKSKYNLKSDPYFTKAEKEKDLKRFKELKETAMRNAEINQKYILFAKMADIVDLDEFLIDIYLFEPSLQLEDFEVDKFNELKDKVLKYDLSKY